MFEAVEGLSEEERDAGADLDDVEGLLFADADDAADAAR